MRFEVDGRSVYAATGAVPIQRARAEELPLVLFVHGAGMDRTVWSQQTRWLAHHGARAVAVDLPGHGFSEGPALSSIAELANWIASTAEALGDPVHVVGHSMGAFIGLETAAQHTDTVASLVLMGLGAAMPVHPDLQAAADSDNPLAADLMAGWMHGPDQKFGLNPTPGMSMTGTSRAVIETSPKGVLANDLTICANYEGAADAAASITCPTTLVLGRLDRMTPRRAAQPLVEALGHARVIELATAGHAPMMEEPNVVRATLADHLAACR